MFAATFVVPTDRDMIQRADAIVVGESLGSYTRINDAGGIETVTSFSVGETIKGSTEHTIDIIEPGGVYQDRAQFIAGVPQFRGGEQSILFLSHAGGRWMVSDIALGKFVFESDSVGQKLAVRAEGDINGWDPDLTPHVEKRRSAEKFLQFLRGQVRDGFAPSDYFVPYHPLRISAAAFFTPKSDVVAYNARSYTVSADGSSTGNGFRWSDFPTQHTFFSGTLAAGNLNSHTYGVSGSTTEPGAPGGGQTAISAALNSWNGDPNSNVNYAFSSAAVACASACKGLEAPDGSNMIVFESDLLNRFGIANFTCTANSYSGVLGLGGISGTNGTHTGPDGNTFWTENDVDVEMNKGIANCTLLFNNNDFNSAVTHEVGHTLGLRHSDQTRADDPGTACSTDSTLECAATAIMHSFVNTGLNAALQSWDQHAVSLLYPCNGTCGGVKTKGDFNADHIADILWRETSSGQTVLWQMAASGNIPSIGNSSYVHPGGNQGFSIVGTGDFNNDGQADILWRDNTSGATYIWIMHGSTIFTSTQIQAGGNQGWNISGVADFDGDGYADILWRQVSNGQTVLWKMTANGSSIPSIASSVNLHPGGNTGFSIVGVGDFDGDGTADILWRDNSSGATLVWKLNPNFTIASSTYINNGGNQGWNVAGIGDFDANGTADVLWRETSSGATVLWQMSLGSIGIANSAFVHGGGNTNYTLVGVADFNADNKADILFRENTSGQTIIWIMNGSSITTSTVIHPGGNTGWNIFSPVK